ncbi:hypothetical protein U9M48_029890 [Paspalum notatum var. saurae]|uniref:Protein kinase domain-containing protein n=1 Tax=Paspalum notatum var. saurae TaxID=547442 RepID=A0AAQ3X2Q2_PASNO
MASALCQGQKKLLLLVVATTVLILQHNTVADGAADENSSIAKPGCQDRCGNVSIPYPFGIGHGCFLNDDFKVHCTSDNVAMLSSFNSTCYEYTYPYGYFVVAQPSNTSGRPLLETNVALGEARVQSPIAWWCNYTGNTVNSSTAWLNPGPSFVVSETKNKFTGVGCATVAFVVGENKHEYASACASFCSDEDSIDDGTECSGMGCCQTTTFPGNLDAIYLEFSTADFDNTYVKNFSPCSYGFIVEADWFKFDPSYAKLSNFKEQYGVDGVPLVLDWVVGNNETSCVQAQKNQSSYACLDTNSNCIDVGGRGYRCNCSQGYEGNPYIDGGCKDINECDFPLLYPCNGKCKNTIGDYTCTCRPGTQSNDPKNEPCNPNIKMVIGIPASLIFIAVCIFIVLTGCLKRNLAKEKERFFQQNGGKILYEQILSRQVDTVLLFTIDELTKATNNFDKSRELGIGGHGTVYKGILKDNRIVAVKRSKIINVIHSEEFVQEIIILSQINHKNVVRLIGCCLEVEVPILVYEFIPNGTLFQLIHGNHGRTPISMEARLKIAQESAEALSYLHLSTNQPIVHGDVKSMNILLDENYMVKVTDFGASRILPKDAVQHMTMVQGTLGYLDPEYLQERRLTEKSDVYSFGVVLLELITRKTAIYLEGFKEERSLASSFLQALKDNKVKGLLDTSIMGVGMEELFQEVVELASMCLISKGEERPSMTEVADKLKAIRSAWRAILLLQHEETKCLLERLAVPSTCNLSPSMYWTAQKMGMDIETPSVDHVSSSNMLR